MIVTETDKRNFDEAFWFASGYTPSSGDWPIYNADNELITTCYGQRAIHEDNSEIILVMGGERAGKSKFTAMHRPSDILVEGGVLWNIGPNYQLAKPEFLYYHETLQRMGLLSGKASMPQEGAMKLQTTWGFTIETKSGSDPETLAGIAPDRINIVEANQLPYSVVEKAYGRALEKKARIVINGTIERSYPWMVEKWSEWQGPNPQGARSYSLPSWSNESLFKEGRYDPEILKLEARYGTELFLERCAAIPVKPSDLVHSKYESRLHVKHLDFNERLPIELAIDPATHTYAIAMVQWETLPVYRWLERFKVEPKNLTREQLQDTRTLMYVIDEVYRHNVIDQDVIPFVKAKPYYKFLKGGVIDIAGTHRNATKSQQQVWVDETNGQISLRSRYCFIEDSINAMNLILQPDPLIGVPLIQFDDRLTSAVAEDGRANGVRAEFGLYRYPPFVPGRAERPKPIDANNDAIKALSYWRFDLAGPVRQRKALPKLRVRRYA